MYRKIIYELTGKLINVIFQEDSAIETGYDKNGISVFGCVHVDLYNTTKYVFYFENAEQYDKVGANKDGIVEFGRSEKECLKFLWSLKGGNVNDVIDFMLEDYEAAEKATSEANKKIPHKILPTAPDDSDIGWIDHDG